MISFIIPSYNGSAILKNNLPKFIEYLNNKKIQFEIIVIDDGSADSKVTKKVTQEMGCQYLENKRNLGKGAAIRKGMMQAKGEYRLFTDVDIPFQFETIDLFLHHLNSGEFDIVIGDRTLPGSTYFTEIPLMRKIGSNICQFIIGRFIAKWLHDTQCGLKGFKAKAAQDLFSHGKINGFAFDIELLYIALNHNYSIKRLPVKFRCNEGTSVKLFRHSLGVLVDLFKIKLNHMHGIYERNKKG